MQPDWNDLKKLTDMLSRLLAEPEDGLATWHLAVAATWKQIYELWMACSGSKGAGMIPVDPECVALARYFLDGAADADGGARMMSLAEAIQQSVEDWFDAEPALGLAKEGS